MRLFRRLLLQRNQFVRHDDLLRHVWDGIRAPSTIRSAVKLLRKQFREAGMTTVASPAMGAAATTFVAIAHGVSSVAPGNRADGAAQEPGRPSVAVRATALGRSGPLLRDWSTVD